MANRFEAESHTNRNNIQEMLCVCEYILHHRHVSPNRAADRIWSSIQCIERKKIFVLQMHLSLRLIGLLACLLLWLDFFFAVDSSSLFYREAQIEASISHEKTRHNNVYDNFRYVQSRNALQIDLNPFSVSVWVCVCVPACVCLSHGSLLISLNSYLRFTFTQSYWASSRNCFDIECMLLCRS